MTKYLRLAALCVSVHSMLAPLSLSHGIESMSQQELVAERLFTSLLHRGKEKWRGPTIPLWNVHSNFLPGGLIGPITSPHSEVGAHPLAPWPHFGEHSLCKPSQQQQHLSSCRHGGSLGGPAWLSSQNMAWRSPSADPQQFRKVPCLRQESCGFLGHDGVTTEERSAPIPRQESGSVLKEPKGSKAQKMSLRT